MSKFSLPPALVFAGAVSCVFPAGAANQDFVFVATLNGASEVPPVSTTALGSVVVTFNVGSVSVSVDASFTGLQGGPASSAGIYSGSPTENGLLRLSFSGFPASTSGAYSHTTPFPGPGGGMAWEAMLFGARAGGAYVNILNLMYPGGEIRGQLVPLSSVPEPGTSALTFFGLALIGWRLRQGQHSPAWR